MGSGIIPDKNEFEKQVFFLGEKIAAVENLRDVVKELVDSVKLCKLNLDSLSGNVVSLSLNVEKNKKESNEKQFGNAQILDRMTNILSSYETLHKAVQEDLKLLNQDSSLHDQKLDVLEKDRKVLSALSLRHGLLEEEFVKAKDMLFSLIAELQNSKKSHEQALLSLGAVQINHMNSIKDHEKKLKDVMDSVSKESSERVKFMDSVQHAIKKMLESEIHYVDQKIAELPPFPEAPKDVSKEILDELVSLRLDVQNSLLKNGNLEVQYKIQEKRIENINLLIQKYELNK